MRDFWFDKMAASAGKPTDVDRAADRAICRFVEETSARETLTYFGPGVLVKFESTEFLNSVGTPKSNYFLVASNQVLPKLLLGTLQKKSEPSVTMVAEFQDLKVGGKLERKPLNELYSSLKDDVFEYAGITYVALTKLRASGFWKSSLLSRALEGMCSLATSDHLQCIVLCNERRINRENKDMDELSTKLYDLFKFDSILARDESRFSSFFLRNEEHKRFVREDEFQNCDGKPLGSIILTKDAKFGGVLNFIEKLIAPAFVGGGFGTDFAYRKQLPTENSYRSSHSLASKAEVEEDLNGEVLVVDLPPENSSKEMPASVEPEQRAHANNNNEEPPVQDPEEQLTDLNDDLIVQATNNKKDSSVQDPEEHLRNQDDDASVHRRNNDRPLAEAPLGETDEERAYPNDVLLQDRSEDGSHEGQVEHLRNQDDDASVHRRNNDRPPAEAPLSETDDERAYPNDVLLQDRSEDGFHEGQDFSNGKHLLAESSHRSSHSLASKAEVEEDLKGEVLVVDLPPQNGSKEMPASVEPEQRAHANNNNNEPSVQDPEEQLAGLNDDLIVQSTNNKMDSSVQDPGECFRDHLGASVHRRNNDGPPSEAPGGETDDERADPNDVLLQDSSGYCTHQGQDGAASGIAYDQRGKKQRVLSDSPHLNVEATGTLQASQRSGQRSLLTFLPGKSALAAATSNKFNFSVSEFEEDLSSSVNQQTSEGNSDRVSEHCSKFPGKRAGQRSSGQPASPQSADVSDIQISQQESLRVSEHHGKLPGRRAGQRSPGQPASPQSADVSDTQTSQQESAREHRGRLPGKRRPRKRSSGEPVSPQSADVSDTQTSQQETLRGASNHNVTMDGCSGTLIIGSRNSVVTYRSTRKCESNSNTTRKQTRKGSTGNTETENEDPSNYNVTVKEHSGTVVLGHGNSVTEYEETLT